METENKPATRTPLNIKVEYRKSYAREETLGTLKNISLSGAFLQHTTYTLNAGDKIALKFSVSGRERLIPAQVIWSNNWGSGVKFLPANNRDVQIVDDLIYYVESKRDDNRSILNDIFKKVS